MFDQDIEAHSHVLVLVDTANRDLVANMDPDRLGLDRPSWAPS